MMCNKKCNECNSHDGNAPPTFCKLMNAEIGAWKSMERYYTAKQKILMHDPKEDATPTPHTP